VVGVDEVGRGSLAGPVVAAAVILDPQQPIAGLTDSKSLSAKSRETLAEQIKQHALAYAIGKASVAEIDEINILQATLLAMRRAVNQLSVKPTQLLIDGNQSPNLPFPTQCIIKGDSKIAAISAASIVAKVTRDHEMVGYEIEFPGYGFAQHKGYGTKQHRDALCSLGVTSIHRRSFAPVKNLLINAALEKNPATTQR